MADAIFYRALRPSWAFDPLSGAGAALSGGRWNAKGAAALYLAADPMTALAEYNQDFLFRPVTLVAYHLEAARLADVGDAAFRIAHDIDAGLLTAAWRAQSLRGETPASWQAAAQLAGLGYDGLLYPSVMAPDGTCIALWRWNGKEGPKLRVQDVDARLPRDRSSWPSET